jgi:hypothetical protein
MNVRVYVAGPYTVGNTIEHIRNASIAASVLRGLGYFPFVPHWMALGELTAPQTYEQSMTQCFEWLEACHALLRLPGVSGGADREVAHAKIHSIPSFSRIEDLARHFASGRA